RVAGDRRAVDQERARHERASGLGDQREAVRPVEAVAGQQPDAGDIAADHQAEAVVLDLVNPAGTARGVLGGGWEAWTNEAGRRSVGTQHAKVDRRPARASRIRARRAAPRKMRRDSYLGAPRDCPKSP